MQTARRFITKVFVRYRTDPYLPISQQYLDCSVVWIVPPARARCWKQQPSTAEQVALEEADTCAGLHTGSKGGGAQYDTAVVYTVCRKLCGGGRVDGTFTSTGISACCKCDLPPSPTLRIMHVGLGADFFREYTVNAVLSQSHQPTTIPTCMDRGLIIAAYLTGKT